MLVPTDVFWPGEIYHLTHRCHNKRFLFRFGLDRTGILQEAQGVGAAASYFAPGLLRYVQPHPPAGFIECAERPQPHDAAVGGRVRGLLQPAEEQSGSFWGDRFHCTMVENGTHLWNCLRYIDLNMVRAGAVSHPGEWSWCGYQELMGLRERFCLLDMGRLLSCSIRRIWLHSEKLTLPGLIRPSGERQLSRESHWTEAIAVGSKSTSGRSRSVCADGKGCACFWHRRMHGTFERMRSSTAAPRHSCRYQISCRWHRAAIWACGERKTMQKSGAVQRIGSLYSTYPIRCNALSWSDPVRVGPRPGEARHSSPVALLLSD